jgi:nitrogen fixation/metabolism regulation signal transduction histidine kinase
MKRLVNEFRDYARLPAADLKDLDLNALVRRCAHLYGSDARWQARQRMTTQLDPA